MMKTHVFDVLENDFMLFSDFFEALFSFGEVLLKGQKYPKTLQPQNTKSVSLR